MDIKQQLIQEIDNTAAPLLVEVLDFLQFLKAKQIEDAADLKEARESLASVATEGTVSWQDLKAEIGL